MKMPSIISLANMVFTTTVTSQLLPGTGTSAAAAASGAASTRGSAKVDGDKGFSIAATAAVMTIVFLLFRIDYINAL